MPKQTSATLAVQYARSLAAFFIVIELVTAAAMLVFILLPMAERAADDLAGLMNLSVATWVELPPETRPAFEDELVRAHGLSLIPDMPSPRDASLRHGFYIRFLERALERRLGRGVFFIEQAAADGSAWLWTAIPAGDRSIGVGFAVRRMQTNPFGALTAALLMGALLVGGLAWWLARRIAKPVARLELAAAHLAQGSNPALLPESGPRELSELARHFNHMAVQVRELSEARTTLFVGISHDLRTPLARMRLALEMLSLKPTPALIDRMERDIEEMNALIAQLLDIARGMSTEPAQDIALGQWLGARALVHRDAADAAGAQLIVRCDDAIFVHAAQGMLARVIDNLIGNALRYAPGPIELVAEPVPTEVAGSPIRLRIGVLDRGPSIPRDHLEAVFRPFHRVEASRSSATGGFGMGLAIVRQLAQANGWRVSLAARPGGGLQAWIELQALI